MVYETKLPRQASTSTVTEDFSEDSEVPCETQRAGDWEQQPQNGRARRQWLSSDGSGQNHDLGVAGATKIWGLQVNGVLRRRMEVGLPESMAIMRDEKEMLWKRTERK